MLLLEKIKKLFESCQAQEKFDRDLIREVKADPELMIKLKEYMQSCKWTEDNLTLFNWFTGTVFNVSINELKQI